MANSIPIMTEYEIQQKSSGVQRGFQYEELLIALHAIRGRKVSAEDYFIDTENDIAGKFDDIIIGYNNGINFKMRVLQAKHSDKEIELENRNFQSGDKYYGLKAYFDSFKKFKDHRNFSVGVLDRLIICTTASIKESNPLVTSADDAIFEKDNNFKEDSFLYFENEKTIMCYKLKKSLALLQLLAADDDANLFEFLQKFRLVSNYPKVNRLDALIEQDFCEHLPFSNNKLMYDRFSRDIIDYRRSSNRKPLNNRQIDEWIAIAYLTDMNLRNWNEIENTKIKFKTNEIGFNIQNILKSNAKICIINSLYTTHFSKIKIRNEVQSSQQLTSDEILLIKANDVCDDSRILDFLKTLIKSQSKAIIYLVIECTNGNQIVFLCRHFNEIINSLEPQMKIIFLTIESICLGDLVNSVQQEIVEEFDKNSTLQDLQKDSSELIMNETIINFLGRNMKLNELINEEIAKELINTSILMSIIKGDIIEIGNENVLREKPFLADIYIERKINELGNTEAVEQTPKELFQNEINRNEKLKIILGEPGAGKTELLQKIALEMKPKVSDSKEAIVNRQKEEILWPIHIKLKDYLNQIDAVLKENIDLKVPNNSLNCFLKLIAGKYVGSSESMDLTINLLRICIANTYNSKLNENDNITDFQLPRIVLLIDGYDELPIKSRDFMLELISELAETNIFQIWLTSRPMKDGCESKLHVKRIYNLAPLTMTEQGDFIVQLVQSRNPNQLAIEERKRIATNFCILFKIFQTFPYAFEKEYDGFDYAAYRQRLLQICAVEENEIEIHSLPTRLVVRRLFDFLKLPLHLQMFCDLCISRLDLRHKFTLSNFYVEFIEMKLKLYYQKIAFPAHAHANSLRIDDAAIQQHCQLAFRLLFPFHTANASTKQLDLSCFHHIGLTVEINSNEVQFVHLSFAEYFLSLFFINDASTKEEFVTLLFDRILFDHQDFSVIRKFFNGNLEIFSDKIKLRNNLKLPTESKIIECLVNAIEEENSAIIEFIIVNSKACCIKLLQSSIVNYASKRKWDVSKYRDATILHLAAIFRNYVELLNFAEEALEVTIFNELLLRKVHMVHGEKTIHGTFLHFVVCGGNLMDFINFYNKYLKAIPLPELLGASNNAGQTILHIHAEMKGDFKELLPFLEANLQTEDFINLLRKRNKKDETFLEIAAKENILSAYLGNWYQEINKKFNFHGNLFASIDGLTILVNNIWSDRYFEELLIFLGKYLANDLSQILKQTNKSGQNIMHFIVPSLNQLNVLITFLKDRCDVNFIKDLLNQSDFKNNTCLHLAAKYEGALKSILSLSYATLGEDFRNYLFKTNKSGKNILFIACHHNNAIILINFLQEHDELDLLNQLINQFDVDGNTCLHYAAHTKNLSVTLLQTFHTILGENFKHFVLQKNNLGAHLLHLSAGKGNEEILIDFINNNAESELLKDMLLQTDIMGRNILHYYVSNTDWYFWNDSYKFSRMFHYANATLSLDECESLILQQDDKMKSFLHHALENKYIEMQFFKALFKFLPQKILSNLLFMTDIEKETVLHKHVRRKNRYRRAFLAYMDFSWAFTTLIQTIIDPTSYSELIRIRNNENQIYLHYFYNHGFDDSSDSAIDEDSN